MARSEDMEFDGITPELFEELAGASELDEGSLAAMLGSVESDLARERGVSAWLRSRPTPVRIALGASLSVLIVTAIGTFNPRSDIDMVAPWRMAVVMASLAALFGASVWFGLRPLHRPPVPGWVEKGLVGLALAGMVALAFLPLEPMPHDSGEWMYAWKCLYSGLIFSFPAYALIRWLDRGGRRMSALLAAAAAGLSGNAALAMACDNDSVVHLLKGHASVGFVFVAAVGLWRWTISRLQPR